MAWYVIVTREHGVQQVGPLPAYIDTKPTRDVLLDQLVRLGMDTALVLMFPVPLGWGA